LSRHYHTASDFVAVLEKNIGLKASLLLMPIQPSDVTHIFADIEASRRDLGFEPVTLIETGLKNFVGWYRGVSRALTRGQAVIRIKINDLTDRPHSSTNGQRVSLYIGGTAAYFVRFTGAGARVADLS
jgi:hypothetical protein